MKWTVREILIGGVCGSVAFVCLGVLIKFVAGEAIPKSEILLTAGAVLALMILGIAWSTMSLSSGWVWRAIEHKTGLVRIFPSFSDCEAELIDQFSRAKSLKILVQIGASFILQKKPLFKFLEGISFAKDASLNFLHASDSSPYLSKSVATKRQSDQERWRKDIRSAREDLRYLEKRHELQIFSREHREPFLARILIFDDVAYVQPYLYAKGNSSKAPIFKFSGIQSWSKQPTEHERSLFRIINKYVDHVWDTAVEARSAAALIPPEDPVCVVGIFRIQQRFVFVVPTRQWLDSSDETIPFHFPGGKVNPKEPWTAAVMREVLEETGVRITVASATETRISSEDNEFRPIDLSDPVKPEWIFERAGGSIPWIVAFQARAERRSSPIPSNETAAVLVLTPDMLRRCLSERVTLESLLSSGDGSTAILRSAANLDKKRQLVPIGLAERIGRELLETSRPNSYSTTPKPVDPTNTGAKKGRSRGRR